MTSDSQELNSQRKNALIVLDRVRISSPASAGRKSWETSYRRCIGSSGRNFITMVSGPMVSDRANASYGLIAACRCISICPDSSYARCRVSASSIRLTPRQAPPSNGFMNIG